MKFGIEYETKVTVEFYEPEKVKANVLPLFLEDNGPAYELDDLAEEISGRLLAARLEWSEEHEAQVFVMEKVGTLVMEACDLFVAESEESGIIELLFIDGVHVLVGTEQIKEV